MEVGLIGAIVSGIGSGVSAIQNADAQGEAKRQFDVQQKKEQDLISQARAKEVEAQEATAKIKKRNAQETDNAVKAFDSNKTIFTGPMGLPTTPMPGTKTLLGS
jgi:hypothetical protein